MRGFGTGFRDMGFGTRIRPASFSLPKNKPQISGVFWSCRNVRIKRTKRTKSPGCGGVSLRKRGVMGGIGFFFEETQGLGRTILSGCSLFKYL